MIDLFRSPSRWFLQTLVVYAAAALIAGALFVIVAAAFSVFTAWL